MTWAVIKDNKIDKIVKGGGITVNGIQHPSSIFRLWSKEELKNIGIVPYSIVKGGDSRFQTEGGIVNEITPDGSEVRGVTQYSDKPLDDVPQVDAEGNPVLDEKGNQVVVEGLKTKYITQVKKTAYSLLEPDDWKVIKSVESGVSLPVELTTYRAAVRSKSDEIEAAINACSSAADLKALLETPVDAQGKPAGNAPINDWPEK